MTWPHLHHPYVTRRFRTVTWRLRCSAPVYPIPANRFVFTFSRMTKPCKTCLIVFAGHRKGETADSPPPCCLYLPRPHKSIMSSEVIDISGPNASQSLCFRHVLPKCSNQLLGIEFSNLQMANLCSKCFQRFPPQMNGGSNHKSMWTPPPLNRHPWDSRAEGERNIST